MRHLAAPFAILIVLGCLDPAQPDALVPATVDQDNQLPSIEVTVLDETRRLHLETFGDSANPTVLVLHGLPGDFRSYLPLSALSDSFHVVMWDLTGNGLSQRLDPGEISFDAVIAEIDAVRRTFVGDGPAALIGHSWGGVFSGLYVAAHPERVSAVVMMEPSAFNYPDNAAAGGLNLFTQAYLDMVRSAEMVGPGSHELLDFRAMQLLFSSVRPYYCDPENPPPLDFWRLGGVFSSQVEVVAFLEDLNFGPDLAAYTGPVQFVAGDCSTIGPDFQDSYNAPWFTSASTVEKLYLNDIGHRLLSVPDRVDELVGGIRNFLEAEL